MWKMQIQILGMVNSREWKKSYEILRDTSLLMGKITPLNKLDLSFTRYIVILLTTKVIIAPLKINIFECLKALQNCADNLKFSSIKTLILSKDRTMFQRWLFDTLYKDSFSILHSWLKDVFVEVTIWFWVRCLFDLEWGDYLIPYI